MKKALRAPSPSMIVALVALLLALAGTGYAAFRLPDNSVGSKQLKTGAVTTKKLHNRAVTGAKLNLNGVTVPNAAHAKSADSAPLSTTLPRGRTLTGEWSAEGHTGTTTGTVSVVSAQSFALALRSAPIAHQLGLTSSPACPGDAAHPKANPGNLCLYIGGGANVGNIVITNASGAPGADPFGFDVVVSDDNANDDFRASGSWAVTAP